MMKNGVAFILICFLCFGCSNQKSLTNKLPFSIKPNSNQKLAEGFVFHDKNKNQLLDSDEKGIANIAVSNGEDIVQTNADGKYQIPVSDDTTIFIIKPKDWMTPLNKQQLPQFYYLHKPNGYPKNFKYKGVEPTGELPKQINFPLYKTEVSEKFKMLVFGDPQPYNIKEIDYFAEDIIAELVDRKDLKFGITMGDIVGDNLDLFSAVNDAVSKVGIPWYNLLGNHDVNYMAPNDVLSDETFERVYGPTNYAFVYGNVHFIVIDNIIHKDKVGARNYVGGLRPDQFSFVSNYLKIVPKEDLVVLNMHIPFIKYGPYFRKNDQKKLFDLLKDFPNTLSITAHTHFMNNEFYHQDSSDWQQTEPHHHFNVGTTSGSWWKGMKGETGVPHAMMRDGTPNGYAIITFDGSEYEIDWKVAGSSENHQMNIHLSRGIVANSEEKNLLTVNFFIGSEKSVLEYRIKGFTDWKPMTKVKKYDPFYVKLNQRWKNFEKLEFQKQWNEDASLSVQAFPGISLPNPRTSTHVWEADLGTDWPLGRHVIEVKATDHQGRTFTAYQSMRVEVK